jgi:hypothetical protein
VRNRLDPVAARDAWRAFAASRVLVLVAASFGAIMLADGVAAGSANPSYVHPFQSWPLSGLFDFLFAPLVRWDAQWYLTIAEHGYRPSGFEDIGARPAFFPVYPLLITGLGGFAGPGAAVISASAISLLSLLPALYLLHRLIALELGEETARSTVWLLALSPVAFFFSAPYTESLFLLLSVGAFYAARTGRWAVAGVLAGIASGTRPTGALLLLPLLMLYLADGNWRPHLRRLRPSVMWLALVPAGVIAFSVYLEDSFGDWNQWRESQYLHGRVETVSPLVGLRRAAAALYHAVEGDVADHLQFPIILESAFFAFAVVAVIGVFRLLPAAYGVYCTAVLIPPLLQPAVAEPLTSMPRFTLTLFPLYVWLAHVVRARGIEQGVMVGFASSLAVLTAAFATWHHLI